MDGKRKAQSLCVLVRVFFWRWELFWSPKKWRKKIFGLIYMVAHKCVVLNFYGAKVIVIFILTRRYLNMKFNLFNRQIIELLAIWITFEAPLWVMWLQFCHMARKSRPENAIYLSPYTYFYFIFSSSSFNIKRICISSIYG